MNFEIELETLKAQKNAIKARILKSVNNDLIEYMIEDVCKYSTVVAKIELLEELREE